MLSPLVITSHLHTGERAQTEGKAHENDRETKHRTMISAGLYYGKRRAREVIKLGLVGFILLVAGVGLFLAFGLRQNGVIANLAIFWSIPLFLFGAAFLLLGGAYLFCVVGRKFLRICKRSLALSGLALSGVSVIAGLLWSLGN